MTTIRLPATVGPLKVTLPGEISAEIVRPADLRSAADPQQLIRSALEKPVGTEPIETRVHAGRKVAVIIDDNTRPTPTGLMLPPILQRLESAGVRSGDIRIVVALGTHHPMTAGEVIRKTGTAIAEAYTIVNDPCWRDDRMVYLGASADDIPAWVHRTVAEADFRVGIGSITPHMDAGYSGGAKIILPGVCGCETVAAFHRRAVDFEGNQLGRINAPLRLDLEAFVAQKVPLDFMVNAVLTGGGELYRCVAGDAIQAHRAGVAHTDEVFGVAVTQRHPLVIANAFPNDQDLWQSTKAIWSGEWLTEDGGLLVLVSPCPGGLGPHPLLADYGGSDPDELLQQLQADRIEDPTACSIAIQLGRMKRRIRPALVSPGFDVGVANRMGLPYFTSVEAAIDHALKGRKPVTSMAVITHGGVTLPLLPERQRTRK